MKQRFKIAMACCLACSSGNYAIAGGLAQEDMTAAATGVANAVVASGDDLSAAIYNPAGLAWQEGVQAMLGNQSRYRTLTANTGSKSFSGDTKPADLTLFAISWLPKGGEWGVAGSIVTPYARRTQWKGELTEQLGETKLNMQRYAVDGFWRVNNTLGASFGFDWYDTDLALKKNAASFAGSGWSQVAAHAGVRWEFVPFWTFAAHFRQGASVTVSNNGGEHVDIMLPDELTIGLAHDLVDDEIRLELDVKRSNWSSFRDLKVSRTGVVSQVLAVNMRDTTDISLGVNWFWRQDTQLRFGYAYEQGANKLTDFQPAFSDQTGHRLSVGFGGEVSGMHLDVGYAAVIYPDIKAKGSDAGLYSDARYSLIFSLIKKF